jgi:diguanylate cyclase (GGDEF)-like protein/PAS domain S-box-containing protein
VLFERNPIPMWVFNRKTLRFLAVNKAALRQYGYSETEFLGMTILEIRPEETVPALIEDVGLRRRGLQERAVWKHRRKDGSIIAVEIVCHDLEFDRTEAMLVAAYDVTERQRAQEAARVAEEKYRAIFDQAVVGIFQHTSDGRPLNVNRAFAKMHGYDSPEQLLAEVSDAAGQLFVEPERMAEIVRAALETGIVRGAEVELYRRDRSRFWVMVNLRAVKDSSGALRLFEGTAEDITDRKAAEAQVKFLAYHDALTGLPNRMLFMDRLENALAGARRKPAKAAVLFLDLDRFKYVNDSLGHSAGDEMLQEIAARLRQCLREEDTVARVGGDEFLIMLREVASREEVEAAAGRIREWVTRSFTIQSHSLSIHRHRHRLQAFSLPGRCLCACPAQYPFAQRQDQPTALRFRNELFRRHASQLRMLPAHQRLRPSNFLAGDLHYRLILQKKFSPCQRRPHLAFDRELCLGAAAHLSRKEAHVVAAVLFRRIHRRVRLPNQRLPVRAVFRIQADADTAARVSRRCNSVSRSSPGWCAGCWLSRVWRRSIWSWS